MIPLFVALQLSAGAAIPKDVAQAIIQVEAQRLPPLALAEFVSATDPEVRVRSARALGRLRSASSLAALQGLIKDSDGDVRFEAAFALGQTSDARHTVLQSLETEQEPRVRAALVDALGKVGQPPDAALLITLLREPAPFRSSAVGAAAAAALGNLARREGVEAVTETAVALLQAIPSLPGPMATSASFALYRLKVSELPAQQQLRWTRLAATHPSAEVRAFLVRGVASWVDKTAQTQVLEPAITDHDPAVRIAAAWAGGEIGWTGFADLLDDDVAHVRLAAIEAAGKSPRVPLSLNKVSSPAERSAILKAEIARDTWNGTAPEDPSYLEELALISAENAVDVLRKIALENDDPAHRTHAMMRWTELGISLSDAILLLEAPDHIVAAVAADWLQEHPSREAEGGLLAAADGASVELLTEIVRALVPLYERGGRGRQQKSARALANRLLQHPSTPVQQANAALREALGLREAPSASHAIVTVDLDDVDPIRGARVTTSKGSFSMRLFADDAPLTVANFAHLAESGFFDNKKVHRVVPDFVVQDGCPRGDGWGGPGYTIPDEINPLKYQRGSVGMALSGPDTGGSQWFVTLSPQPHLDGTYTLFGEVTTGMHVVESIVPGDLIETITIERTTVADAEVAGQTEADEETK